MCQKTISGKAVAAPVRWRDHYDRIPRIGCTTAYGVALLRDRSNKLVLAWRTEEGLVLLVTIDAVCLIDWMDKKDSFRLVGTILQWNRKGLIKLFASSRVWTLDTRRMNPEGRKCLEILLQDEGITLAKSSFRVSISALGSGHDPWGGPKANRSPEEIQQFIRAVGKSPEWGPGTRNLARFGDYDALRDHYFAGRHVFVTRDGRGYLSVGKRLGYEAKLGLLIRSPEEFTLRYPKGAYVAMLERA